MLCSLSLPSLLPSSFPPLFSCLLYTYNKCILHTKLSAPSSAPFLSSFPLHIFFIYHILINALSAFPALFPPSFSLLFHYISFCISYSNKCLLTTRLSGPFCTLPASFTLISFFTYHTLINTYCVSPFLPFLHPF
jgi:hypothetical protein